jgi:hypothetical protein
MKFLAFALTLVSIGLGWWIMIQGWGVQPQSWPIIIGGTVATLLLLGLAAAISEAGK